MTKLQTKRSYVRACPYGCCTDTGQPSNRRGRLLRMRLNRRRSERAWRKEYNAYEV